MNKLLFPILSIIAALGLYFVYISPTYEVIKEHQAKEAEFDRAFAEIEEVKKILEELGSSYSEISRDDLLRLEIFLPKSIDIARVVQNVGGIVGRYGVPMEEIRITSKAQEEDSEVGIREHEINFSINARYNDFLNILSDIETNVQLAKISKVELFSDKFSFTSTSYKITLTLYSFE